MTEAAPFMEIVPGYGHTVTNDLILEIAALVILILLIVQYVRRKHHAFELSLFFQMCLTDLLMVICFMAFDIFPLFETFDENYVLKLLLICYVLSWIINRIFSVALSAQWLLYVEYTLHQSRDLIRRRYPAVMIPFFAAVVMMIINIPVGLWHGLHMDAPPILTFIHYALQTLSYVVLVFYIIAAYIILYLEKKRNRIPAFIRLTPTTLCMIAGFIADLFLTDYPVLPLFFALGLMFADYYLYRRLQNIDPKTGFFNRKYLSALITFAKKKQLKGATVFRFKTQRGSGVIEAILKFWVPEQCKIITMGDGLYLMVSGAVKDSVSERFISLVTEEAKNKGIPMDSGYETDREKPMDELLSKYV